MSRSPFEIFNIQPSFDLDLNALEILYYKLSRQHHPDHLGKIDKSLVMQAQSQIAAINFAYQTLKNQDKRLEYLISTISTTDNDSAIPTELSEEFFEIQELAFEDTEKAISSATTFIAKIENKISKIKEEIIKNASLINWNNSDDSFVEKYQLKKLSKGLTYLSSLQENALQLLNKCKNL